MHTIHRTSFWFTSAWIALVLLPAGIARADIPAGKDLPTQRMAAEHALAFEKKFTADAYKANNVQGHEWDAGAIHFLTEAPRRLAKLPDAPSVVELERDGRLLYLHGCDDALVRYFHCRLLYQLGRTVEAAPRIKGSTSAMVSQGYAPMWQLAAATQEYGSHIARNEKNQAAACADAAVEAIRQMLAGSDYGKEHRAELIDELNVADENFSFDIRKRFWEAARDVKDADQPAVLLLEGLYHISAAWESRGSGWGNAVTQEGWKGFETHLKAADDCLTRGWEADPTVPEIPAAMMSVALGAGGPNDMRLWLERTIKARFDYSPAYHNFIYGLYPRWHGDRQSLLNFGIECLDTHRFDTEVPLRFFDVLLAVRSECDNGDMTGWARDEVYDKVKDLLDKSTSADGVYPNDPYYRSLQAAFCVQTGHWEDARKAIETLDGPLYATGTRILNVTPAEVRGAAFAFTGESGIAAAKARGLIAEGKRKEAIEIYQAAARDQKDHDAARFLQTLVQVNQWVETFDSGKEVALKTDPRFSGFHAAHGQWRADDDGGYTLLASNQNNSNLICEADFGESWELSVRIDFLHKEADWDAAGITLAVPGNVNYLGLNISTKNGAFAAHLLNAPGEPTHATVKEKDNQITLRRDGIKLIATVNGKEVFRGTTPNDDETHHLRIGFGGYPFYKNDSVRFHDVTIRQTKGEK